MNSINAFSVFPSYSHTHQCILLMWNSFQRHCLSSRGPWCSKSVFMAGDSIGIFFFLRQGLLGLLFLLMSCHAMAFQVINTWKNWQVVGCDDIGIAVLSSCSQRGSRRTLLKYSFDSPRVRWVIAWWLLDCLVGIQINLWGSPRQCWCKQKI